MRHLDLFSGIGGFALATEMVWDDVEHVFCDNEPFAQTILKKHWPNAQIYGDIRGLTADAKHRDELAQEEIQTRGLTSFVGGTDLLTGGFPCQPFSQAGRRRGTEDDRHLWPEMLRVIREFHPRWVVGENVGGLVTWSDGLVLEQVHTDLEGEGYEVQAFIVPAVSLNAPHRRDRVWIVGHASNSSGERWGKSRELECSKRKIEAERRLTWEIGDASRSTDSDAPNSISAGTRGAHGSAIGAGERGRQEPSKREGSEVRSNITDGDTPRGDDTNATGERLEYNERRSEAEGRGNEPGGVRGYKRPNWNQNWLEVATRLCRVDDGLPRRMDRNPRLKALGNAIVPQVAAEIFKAIKETDLAWTESGV